MVMMNDYHHVDHDVGDAEKKEAVTGEAEPGTHSSATTSKIEFAKGSLLPLLMLLLNRLQYSTWPRPSTLFRACRMLQPPAPSHRDTTTKSVGVIIHPRCPCLRVSVDTKGPSDARLKSQKTSSHSS